MRTEKNSECSETKWKVPFGWIIKTYRHLNVSPSDFKQTEMFFEDLDKNRLAIPGSRDISYGNYDRIQMLPVDSFSDYAKEAYQTYRWYGSSQAIFIFPIQGLHDSGSGEEEKKSPERIFGWGSDEDTEESPKGVRVNDAEGIRKLEDFFAVSFCYISDEARNRSNDYEDLLSACRDSIVQLVKSYNDVLKKEGEKEKKHSIVRAEVFGSLSPAEVIIIWSSKQYTDILYLVDRIRDFQFMSEGITEENKTENNEYNVFRTTYTMVSFPDVITGISSKNESLADVLGSAYIQFVMQKGGEGNRLEDFRNFLIQCRENAGKLIGEKKGVSHPKFNLRRSAGEYDLICEMESRYIPRLFSYPKNWKDKGDDTWKIDPNDPEYYFCSMHHPVFNKFVLYSFTRLSYQEKDLPSFTRPLSIKISARKWRKEIETVSKIVLKEKPGQHRDHTHWRSGLIKNIEKNRKPEFLLLLESVDSLIPGISNLHAELEQLFSDYVQCCSSSADHLWIEDYDEIFRQVVERINQAVQGIGIWQDYDYTESRREEWENAREKLSAIRSLIKALHQQTSHITASNKLFFKEQDTHFGYTAQHDLVIHAYYDIIKKLVKIIYSYTNPVIQSELYPLVNFSPEDRISSQIFMEESAQVFLKDSQDRDTPGLRPRVMVIHIPQDGMYNIMHYLPMLCHEVFHYAAPRDRNIRNQKLANIVICQALRQGFFMMFREQINEYVKTNPRINAIDRNYIEKKWVTCIDSFLGDEIRKKSEAIYAGLKKSFFQEETNEECNSDLIESAPILRSWFLVWLRNWLNSNHYLDRSEEESNDLQDIKGTDDIRFDDFGDLLCYVFTPFHNALKREINNLKRDSKKLSTVDRAYLELITDLEKMILGEGDIKKIHLYRAVVVQASEFVNSDGGFPNLLKQLDELFPDLAMVCLMKMSAAEYMLQIALDLDKQLYHGEDYYLNQIRFMSVLYCIFRREKNTDVVNDEKVLDEAIKKFRVLYLASYKISYETHKCSEGDKKRADKWCIIFKEMYTSYLSDRGFDSFGFANRSYVIELLGEMVSCLDMQYFSEEEKNVYRDSFAKPYHEYIELLQKAEESEKAQNDILVLSIRTILRFQGRQSLKQLNSDFRKTPPGSFTPLKISIPSLTTFLSDSNYERRLLSISDYFISIQYAINQLYRYREMEKTPSATGMWYRGVSNVEHPILPSGFVHFAEDAVRLRGQYPSEEPYYYIQTQLHNYETFRYSVEGANTEIDPARYYYTINYLTLMQHYSQHTNLLDWSEDSFASTYFALEDEVNINDKYEYQRIKDKDTLLKNRDKDAVLYILDPVRFNKACEEIEQEAFFSEGVRQRSEEKLMATIPNLSIKENQELLQEYHMLYQRKPGDKDIIYIKEKKDTQNAVSLSDLSKGLSTDQRLDFHLPRAVYTAKLNARIRAQSGLFVAFSLKSLPVSWENEVIKTDGPNARIFSYQALESIQNYYLDLSGKKPFLMKIIIPAELKEEMGAMVYRFGISKERIYPEMQNNRNR